MGRFLLTDQEARCSDLCLRQQSLCWPRSSDHRAVYETLERKRVSAHSQATIFKAGTYVVPDVMRTRPSLKKSLVALPLRSVVMMETATGRSCYRLGQTASQSCRVPRSPFNTKKQNSNRHAGAVGTIVAWRILSSIVQAILPPWI